MKPFQIENRPIGAGHPPYIIAEVSGNHNKDLGRALRMMEVAKECGADAVKFQTYTADSLAIPSRAPEFMIETGTWAGWNIYELYQSAATPYDWFPEIFAHGRKIGITVFSSAFDGEGVDLLESLDAPAYKIASNELTDWPLVQRVVETGKPVILSTGTASLEEVDDTVAFLRECGAESFALLHCISAYPAPPETANLRTMEALARRFDVPVGLSDHTLASSVAAAATALGATIIEKHFVIDRNDGGPDSSFALEPAELKDLCQSCLTAFQALGTVSFGKKEVEKTSPIYRKRFYTSVDIAEGEPLSLRNLKAIRSPFGIESREFKQVFASRARRAIPKHTALDASMIQAD